MQQQGKETCHFLKAYFLIILYGEGSRSASEWSGAQEGLSIWPFYLAFLFEQRRQRRGVKRRR